MAHAYIGEGPAGGNRLMPELDKESENIQGKVEQLARADATVRETANRLHDSIRGIQDGGDRFVLVTAVIGILGTLSAAAMGALLFVGVVRPLDAMAAAMRRLASDDLGRCDRGPNAS